MVEVAEGMTIDKLLQVYPAPWRMMPVGKSHLRLDDARGVAIQKAALAEGNDAVGMAIFLDTVNRLAAVGPFGEAAAKLAGEQTWHLGTMRLAIRKLENEIESLQRLLAHAVGGTELTEWGAARQVLLNMAAVCVATARQLRIETAEQAIDKEDQHQR